MLGLFARQGASRVGRFESEFDFLLHVQLINDAVPAGLVRQVIDDLVSRFVGIDHARILRHCRIQQLAVCVQRVA